MVTGVCEALLTVGGFAPPPSKPGAVGSSPAWRASLRGAGILGEILLDSGPFPGAALVFVASIRARPDGPSVFTFGKDTPMGRPGQPAELASIYVELASPGSSYSTGQIFGATGGRGGP